MIPLRNYPVPEPATLDKVYLLPEKARGASSQASTDMD